MVLIKLASSSNVTLFIAVSAFQKTLKVSESELIYNNFGKFEIQIAECSDTLRGNASFYNVAQSR